MGNLRCQAGYWCGYVGWLPYPSRAWCMWPWGRSEVWQMGELPEGLGPWAGFQGVVLKILQKKIVEPAKRGSQELGLPPGRDYHLPHQITKLPSGETTIWDE